MICIHHTHQYWSCWELFCHWLNHSLLFNFSIFLPFSYQKLLLSILLGQICIRTSDMVENIVDVGLCNMRQNSVKRKKYFSHIVWKTQIQSIFYYALSFCTFDLLANVTHFQDYSKLLHLDGNFRFYLSTFFMKFQVYVIIWLIKTPL